MYCPTCEIYKVDLHLEILTILKIRCSNFTNQVVSLIFIIPFPCLKHPLELQSFHVFLLPLLSSKTVEIGPFKMLNQSSIFSALLN
jgi:hypothetical protein